MKTTGLSLLLGALLMAGCQRHAEKAGVALTLLRQSSQCGVRTAQIRLLGSMEAIHRLTGLRTVLNAKTPVLEVDFATQAVVLLAMGEQPSVGYRIELEFDGVEKRGTSLWLPVRFDTPSGMAATVITSPCVVFSVPRQGLKRIVAGDTGLSVDL